MKVKDNSGCEKYIGLDGINKVDKVA